MAVSNQFEVLGTLEDPGELWDAFEHELPKAAEECSGEQERSRTIVILR